jgi:L-fuculokinase
VAEAVLFKSVSLDDRALTAVVDIGKTHSRLLLLRSDGSLVDAESRASKTVSSEYQYMALDTEGTEAWLFDALTELGSRSIDLHRIIVSTHGAAVAVLAGERLAFPVPDYEWEGFDERGGSLEDDIGPFEDTLSPLLPRGLNMGVQLDWLNRHYPERCAQVTTLMPYAQYWAWVLSGEKSTEVSSMGCHTLLWHPKEQTYSRLAHERGWAGKFAPLRKAWEVLGPIRSALADSTGLPRRVQVHVGVHDSNSCLARYLRSWPRMTLISTGTWVVAMTPGAGPKRLHAKLQQLGNVSVRGEWVPTGRFMGGREIERLCAGADPSGADLSIVPDLLRRRVQIVPGAEAQAGIRSKLPGKILVGERSHTLEEWRTGFTPVQRATAAALYTAQLTAWTLRQLDAFGPIVLEGPFTQNAVIPVVLATLLPEMDVYTSSDPVEGSAGGGWCLTRWTEPVSLEPSVDVIKPARDLSDALAAALDDWLQAIALQT